MLKKFAITFAVVGLSALAVGCNKEKALDATASSPIAVVDLQKVGNAMGWADEMQKNLMATQGAAVEQFNKMLKPAQDAVAAKQGDIAKAHNLSAAQLQTLANPKSRADLEKLGLTSAEIDDLLQTVGEAINQSTRANQQVSRIVNDQRAAIFQKYREAAAPSIRRVALAGNRMVVLTPGAELLYSDPSADISDKVIDDLQHSSSAKVELPAPPKLDLPASPTTRPR